MDRPVQPSRRPWFITAVITAGLVSLVMVPVAAVATWLLVTDPVVAGEVAADGSLAPLIRAIARTFGRAIVELLVYL